MPEIRDDANSGVMGTLYDIFIQGFFYGNWFMLYLFLSAIFLAIGRIILIAILAIRQYYYDKNEQNRAYRRIQNLPR